VQKILMIAAVGVLFCLPDARAQQVDWDHWFSCWPASEAPQGAEAVGTEVRVLGLTVSFPDGWSREKARTRFQEEFGGPNGASILMTRQRSVTPNDSLLNKLERRGYGTPWQSERCALELVSGFSSLPNATFNSYRSSLYFKGWKTTVLLQFRDGTDWVTIRFQQRWKKSKNRVAPHLVMGIFESVTSQMVNLAGAESSVEEHSR
jgi:hypothetical protein